MGNSANINLGNALNLVSRNKRLKTVKEQQRKVSICKGQAEPGAKSHLISPKAVRVGENANFVNG